MSCSARLPVYTLLISLIVPEKNIFGIISLQGLMLLGMYLFGVIATLIVAGIVQFFVKNDVKNYFIMEMPVYRVPVWKNALAIMISKSKAFVMNAGKIILAVSVLLWILGTFGPPNKFKAIDEKYAIRLEAGDAEVETQLNAEKLEYSYLGYLGKGFEPIIKPLGFDWKIGISIISSFVAREVFVGTLSTIYGLSDADQTITLKQKMQKDKWPDGRPIYTPIVALSLMLFYAFALQCFSTIAIVKRETGGWRWPIIQFVLFSLLAYCASLLVYQLGIRL
ncbi:MAG: ferrous iron transporter B [Bacteroidetes bacterium]|nr:ferrous iron transporter B [Bacteroidota bacterium]